MRFQTRYFAVIGLLLFVYILLNIGPGKIFNLIIALNPLYLLLLIPVVSLNVVFKGLKWKIVIMACGLNYSLKNSCVVYLIGSFVGMITPGRVGEFIKAAYLRRNSAHIGRALSTVVIDRLIDVVTLLFLSLIAIIWMAHTFSRTLISPLIIIGIIATFSLSIYLFFHEGIARRVFRPFFNILAPEKYKGYLKLNFDDFYTGLKDINKKLTGIAFALGLITLFITALGGYVILLSLDLKIPYFYLVLFMAIITLVETLPISIMGLGTREAASIFLLSLVGIASEEAVAFSILYLVLDWGMVILAGGALMIKRPIEISIR